MVLGDIGRAPSKECQKALELARILSEDKPLVRVNVYRVVGRDNWLVACDGWNSHGTLYCSFLAGRQLA